MSLHVVILAAGKGTRMRSGLPKVLHPIAGRPMLQHVIDTANTLDAAACHVVIGHGAGEVRETVNDALVNFVLQEQQLGTGHAVAQAMPSIPDDATVLVLYGDVPLVSTATLRRLLDACSPGTYAMLTVELEDPTGYGRIVRGKDGKVQAIVEQKDASAEQLEIQEVNTGIVAGAAADLKRWLPKLSNSNAQGEYYLTDLTAMAVAEGRGIAVEQAADATEVEGVNSRLQQYQLERQYQRLQAEQLMVDGVTLMDAARIDIRGKLSAGEDVMIDVNCVFIGDVSLGDGVQIGPNCVLTDVTVGAGTVIKPNCVLEQATVGCNADIGPFARIRPGTVMADGSKIGNFVETKKAYIGKGSKVNHLTYIGDAELGDGVNVGAGTITCNYDGVNKHKTVMGNGVFIGSNSTLVAPLTIADNGFVAAGSTVTSDVPAETLAVGRGKQRNIEGWKRPKKDAN